MKEHLKIGDHCYIISKTLSTYRTIKVNDVLTCKNEHDKPYDGIRIRRTIEEINIPRNYKELGFRILELEILTKEFDDEFDRCSSAKVVSEVDIASMFPYDPLGFVSERKIKCSKFYQMYAFQEGNAYTETFTNIESNKTFTNVRRTVGNITTVDYQFPEEIRAIIVDYPSQKIKEEKGTIIRGDRKKYYWNVRHYLDEKLTKVSRMNMKVGNEKPLQVKFDYNEKEEYIGAYADRIVFTDEDKTIIQQRNYNEHYFITVEHN